MQDFTFNFKINYRLTSLLASTASLPTFSIAPTCAAATTAKM